MLYHEVVLRGAANGRGRSTVRVAETNSTGDILRTFEAGLGKADRVKHQGPSRSVVRTRTQTADHIHQKTDPHLPSQKRIRLLPSMKLAMGFIGLPATYSLRKLYCFQSNIIKYLEFRLRRPKVSISEVMT
jgi:hypothetical protein